LVCFIFKFEFVVFIHNVLFSKISSNISELKARYGEVPVRGVKSHGEMKELHLFLNSARARRMSDQLYTLDQLYALATLSLGNYPQYPVGPRTRLDALEKR
jgi:hypothetical protein